MYLVIEVHSDIQITVFNWVFEYEVLFDVRDIDMWHLILYVNDEEWRDIETLYENQSVDIPGFLVEEEDKETSRLCKTFSTKEVKNSFLVIYL